MTPNLLGRGKFRVIMRKKKHHRQLFNQAIDTVVNFIRNRFRQKEYIAKKILVKKILVVNFSECFRFLAVTWIN